MLQVENLERSYRSGRERVKVLERLNLEVARGQLAVVAGRSGSGKTTLLHLLAGLDRPDAGTLRLGEVGLQARSSERELVRWRRQVSFLHQTPVLIPTLSAWENALLPYRYAGRPDLEWVRSLFTELGLSGLERRRPRQLSGGQAMRVALARALARRGSLLLADEPTGRLDAQTAQTVWTLLERLSSEQGITAVVVTHDPIVLERANTVYHLQAGRLELASKPTLPQSSSSASRLLS